MAGGLFVSDCASSSLAWIDIGCTLENAGSAVGSTITSALEPVWIILAIVVVLVIIIAFAPNVKHIIPHIGLG